MTADEIGGLYKGFSSELERLVRGAARATDPVTEDACQAAWGRLIWHRDQVDPASAPGWLVKTALREAVRLSRRGRRDMSLESELERSGDVRAPRASHGPGELLELREQLRLVGLLPVRQQRVLWLHSLGLSYLEISEREACTTRTVERQLLRARRRLRSAGQLDREPAAA